MRTTVVGLVALPVLLGGLGLAAAAVYYSETPSFSAEPTPTQTQTQNQDAGAGDGGGTSIDGRRPHLTVHDGNRLLLAGSLAGLHSARPIPVPPLPVDAPPLRNAYSAVETTVPATAAPTWSAELAVPQRRINAAPSTQKSVPPPSVPPPSVAPADDVSTSGWRPDPARTAGTGAGPPTHANASANSQADRDRGPDAPTPR